MSTSPHAAAAATARQRLAGVLGTLQQDPNIPPAILDVVSGLARAVGPLFQLERGSADLQLFVQARGVLQETLEKMQAVDQGYPGIADATGAIAQSLGTIFVAMREAGMIPAPANPAPAAAPAPAPAAPATAAPVPAAAPVVVPAPAVPVPAPAPMAPQVPASMPQAQPQPYAPPVAPAPAPAPTPMAMPAPAARPQPAPMAMPMAAPGAPAAQHGGAMPMPGPQRSPSTHAMRPVNPAAQNSVPTGPSGLPRLESEIGVHTETNFYTDFLGDIRNRGGIFVATFHVLAAGTPCEVFLTFPGNLTAELRGTVRWKREASPSGSMSSSPGLGIEISHADSEAWNLIDRFIRKREPIMHEM